MKNKMKQWRRRSGTDPLAALESGRIQRQRGFARMAAFRRILADRLDTIKATPPAAQPSFVDLMEDDTCTA